MGDVNFRYDPNAPRHRAEGRLRAERATSAGRTPAGSASSTRPTCLSSSASSGATSSRQRRRRRPSALTALYKRSGYKIAAGRGRHTPAPAPLQRAAHDEATGRPGRRHAPRARRPVDTGAWAWIADIDGQRLFYPAERRRLEEERWLDTSTFRGRWIAANYAARKYALDPDDSSGKLPMDAQELLSRALDFWGDPDAEAGHAHGASRLRQDRAGGCRPGLEEGPVPGARPERPAHARRRLSRLPDLLT